MMCSLKIDVLIFLFTLLVATRYIESSLEKSIYYGGPKRLIFGENKFQKFRLN